MSLVKRVSRVARAELASNTSNSITPEEEIESIIKMIESAITKTQVAIARTPLEQRETLELNLTSLRKKLQTVTTKRNELKCRVYRVKAEAYFRSIEKVVGNDLNELIELFEEINRDIAAMKVQLSA